MPLEGLGRFRCVFTAREYTESWFQGHLVSSPGCPTDSLNSACPTEINFLLYFLKNFIDFSFVSGIHPGVELLDLMVVLLFSF